MEPDGNSRLDSGIRTPAAATTIRNTVALRSSERVSTCGIMIAPAARSTSASCFHRPPFQRKQAAGAFLDEQDDQDQNGDLAEYRAGHRFEEFVGDAEGEGADQRAPQIADAAEHHHHEGVDDIALAEIGADIVD